MAETDCLTGPANRRDFQERVRSEIARSLRTQRHLSVALLDVEGASFVTDAQGHATGDTLLQRVAQRIARRTRIYDVAVQQDAAEFAILFPETTGAQAEAVLTRFRPFEIALPGQQRTMTLTVSWGIATWPADGSDPDALLQMAKNRQLVMKGRLRA